MIIYLFLFLVALGSVHILTPLSIKIAGKIGRRHSHRKKSAQDPHP